MVRKYFVCVAWAKLVLGRGRLPVAYRLWVNYEHSGSIYSCWNESSNLKKHIEQKPMVNVLGAFVPKFFEWDSVYR